MMCSWFAASSKVMPFCLYWRPVAHGDGITVKVLPLCAAVCCYVLLPKQAQELRSKMAESKEVNDTLRREERLRRRISLDHRVRAQA